VRLLELEQDVLDRVEANLETPCVRNPRTLLLCAVAHVHAGDPTGADRLERRAKELWMEGYGLVLDAALLKLALARGDLSGVDRIVGQPFKLRRQTWFFAASVVAELEALAALGRRQDVERLAAAYSRPRTVIEPHALRALGIVRESQELIREAIERFEKLGLAWHAEQTRSLIAQA
jgi:hypothetical protein